MNPNLERFKRREQTVEINGATFVVRELATAADVAGLRDDPDYSYRVLVQCVFMPSGEPAFTVEDIPDMKTETSLFLMSKLVSAVYGVNGMSAEEEVKNSVAAPTGG